EQSVLTPAVGAAARVVVGEVRPARAVGGVVLAHRAPLPLGEVRAPPFPVLRPARVFFQPDRLGVVHVPTRRRPSASSSTSTGQHERGRGRRARSGWGRQLRIMLRHWKGIAARPWTAPSNAPATVALVSRSPP